MDFGKTEDVEKLSKFLENEIDKAVEENIK
jgi:hypothetical protein